MKTFEITSRKHGTHTVIIDQDDWEKVKKYRWYLARFHKSDLYVLSNVVREGKSSTLYLHRLVLNNPKNAIDHINRNPLDNRKENLREAIGNINQQNTRKYSGSTSAFKGVYWHKQCRKWYSSIRFQGRNIVLGRFEDEKEAALYYDEAADQIGHIGPRNFPKIKE